MDYHGSHLRFRGFVQTIRHLSPRTTHFRNNTTGLRRDKGGPQTVVFSRTLNPSDYPGVTITEDLETVRALKAKPGKDIWLFGGGELFRSLLDANLVDTVEVAVMPILLSEGIPLLPPGARSPSLRLCESKALPSGTVLLTYALPQS